MQIRMYKDAESVGWTGWIEDDNGKNIGFIKPDGTLVFQSPDNPNKYVEFKEYTMKQEVTRRSLEVLVSMHKALQYDAEDKTEKGKTKGARLKIVEKMVSMIEKLNCDKK